MTQLVGRLLALMVAVYPGIPNTARWWILMAAMGLLVASELVATRRLTEGEPRYNLRLGIRLANILVLLVGVAVPWIIRFAPVWFQYLVIGVLVMTLVTDLLVWMLGRGDVTSVRGTIIREEGGPRE